MKLWQFAFLSIILVIILWFFSCGIIKKEDRSQQTAIEVNIVQRDDEEEFMVVRNISKGKIKHHVPKFMLELYEKSKMVKKDERIPDVVKSVIPAYGGTHYSNLLETDLSDNHHILVFNVPNSDKDEVFLKAELQVLTLIEIKSKLALGLERQIRISLYNETTNELKLLEEKHIYHSNNTWLSFNVSHAVKTVLQNPKTKILKFIIAVKLYQPFINNKKGVLKLSLMPVADNFEHNYPILLLFYTNVKIQTNQSLKETPKQENIKKKESFRVRRYIEEDYEEESNKIWDDDNNNKVVNRKLRRMRNNCRKRPLYVDFAEIQYDSWIVQPSGYEAYQCWGKCFYPVAEHLSPTKHAIVQALLHSVSPSRAPRSCCVPTKLDSISVLYVDAQGILTYRYAYKDMVVIDCGCR